jgi:hypothetical protein
MTPPDERRVEPPCERRSTGKQRPQAEVGNALEPLDVDGVCDEPPRCVVEEDLARPCAAGEASCGSGDGSNRQRSARRDDLAGGDANRRLEVVALGELIAQVDRGSYRAEGIVLVRRGKAKRRRDRVRELRSEVALVATDDVERLLERPFELRIN